MTFIQPNKGIGIINAILVLLVIGLGAGVFGVVALYNTTVNLNHNIAAAKTQLDTIGAENTNLSNQVITALGSDAITAIVAKEGLVAESKPHYFPVNQAANQTWPIASQ